jgi:dTDP-4-amino-4,6-dideoxygalactose transaminase
MGHAAAFSFYPSKNLGALGDGGLITTSDDRAAGKLRLLRNYGQRVKYHHAIPGTNSRLDTLQAAVLSIKLPHLDGWNAARRRHAAAYDARLKDHVQTPVASLDVEHIYHLYVIETPERDALAQRLKAKQIQTGIHYPVPAHLQEACRDLGYKAGDFPVTEAAASRILSLPMFAELSDTQIDYVCDTVARRL